MDEKKLRYRNFPSFLIKPLIKVAAFGEEKHGALSFLTDPITVNDHLDALKRHMDKLEDPNVSDIDDESKELHSSHMAWRALAITHLLSNKKELDDRYKTSLIEKKQEYIPSHRWSVNPDQTVSLIEPDKTPDNFLTPPFDITKATFLPEDDLDWQRRKDSYEPSFSADSVSAGDTGPGHWDLDKVQDGYVDDDMHKLEMETRHMYCACKVCENK